MVVILLIFLIAVLTGSSNPVFIRFATTEVPPLTFTAARFLLAAFIFFLLWRKKKEFIKPSELYKLLPYTLNMSLYAVGIQYTSVTMSGILYTFAPVLTAIFGFFLLREGLSRLQVIGLSFAILGVALLFQGSIEANDIFSFGMPLGNVLILFAVCSWGFYPIGARSLSKTYSSATILLYSFAITALLLFLILPLEWQIRPFDFSKISQTAMVSLFGVTFIGTILFYSSYQWLIKHTTAFIASLNLYGGLVSSAVYGGVFFQERLTGKLIFGALLVVAGIFLATTYTQLKKNTHLPYN